MGLPARRRRVRWLPKIISPKPSHTQSKPLKSAITGMNEHAVLAECERGEDAAKAAYVIRRDTAHLVNTGSKATIRILDTDEILQEGLTELGRLDPVITRIIAEGVMNQQLSVASADAILTRLVGPLAAQESFTAMPVARMRSSRTPVASTETTPSIS